MKRDKLIDFLIESTDLYEFSKMKNLEIFNQVDYLKSWEMSSKSLQRGYVG